MEQIINAIENALDYPALFLLYMLGFYALIVLIGAVISYIVACSVQKKTQMDGVMCVSLTLNKLPAGVSASELPDGLTQLNFGTVLVGMKDPDRILHRRVDPRLTWIQKALRRQYQVGRFLERFQQYYERAGFKGDASCHLLTELCRDDEFCAKLGQVCRRDGKKGMRHELGDSIAVKDGRSTDKLYICHKLPVEAAARFSQDALCEVRNICITLEYLDSPAVN